MKKNQKTIHISNNLFIYKNIYTVELTLQNFIFLSKSLFGSLVE